MSYLLNCVTLPLPFSHDHISFSFFQELQNHPISTHASRRYQIDLQCDKKARERIFISGYMGPSENTEQIAIRRQQEEAAKKAQQEKQEQQQQEIDLTMDTTPTHNRKRKSEEEDEGPQQKKRKCDPYSFSNLLFRLFCCSQPQNKEILLYFLRIQAQELLYSSRLKRELKKAASQIATCLPRLFQKKSDHSSKSTLRVKTIHNKTKNIRNTSLHTSRFVITTIGRSSCCTIQQKGVKLSRLQCIVLFFPLFQRVFFVNMGPRVVFGQDVQHFSLSHKSSTISSTNIPFSVSLCLN